MDQPGGQKALDTIQERLTNYASRLDYEQISPEAIHTAKLRVMDNLGTLIGGFFSEPAQISRNVARQMPDPSGATIIGTRNRTTVDMAAYVNSNTARYVELMDVYHWPGAYNGHPSDVMMSVLAAAEHVNASGRELLTAVVLAYEV